jgi:hypothetical protein
MKYLTHIFQTKDGSNMMQNIPLVGSDICLICNQTAREIGLQRLTLHTGESLNKQYATLTCLTKEEFLIKKALE